MRIIRGTERFSMGNDERERVEYGRGGNCFGRVDETKEIEADVD